MTIELSAQLETALAHEAERRGTTPQALAVRMIESQLPPSPVRSHAASDEQPRTMHDVWSSHIGAVASEPGDDANGRLSQETGRRFTELLIEQRRQGRS